MMAGTWTEARVVLLTALWADGIAAGVIAKRMGMTRGMVAGKRHSLGLPPRSEAVQKAAQAANARRTAGLCEAAGSRADPETMRRKAAEVTALEAAVRPLRGSNPRPWELRRFGECAFPVAGYGADTLSCCEPAEAGRPYCFGHCELLAGRPWPPEDASAELAASQWASQGASQGASA
jgi:hypothetical protein